MARVRFGVINGPERPETRLPFYPEERTCP
jgi:hypothetical protein